MTRDSRPSLGNFVAVLLNPPSTTAGTRTTNAVKLASNVLGFGDLRVANLCSTPSRSVVELNVISDTRGWMRARDEIQGLLSQADGVLAAWGVSGLSGAAGRNHQRQVTWFLESAKSAGIESLWMVGGQPRHPSRWHQYVADKYGRTSGGTFAQRLSEVLQEVPIGESEIGRGHSTSTC